MKLRVRRHLALVATVGVLAMAGTGIAAAAGGSTPAAPVPASAGGLLAPAAVPDGADASGAGTAPAATPSTAAAAPAAAAPGAGAVPGAVAPAPAASAPAAGAAAPVAAAPAVGTAAPGTAAPTPGTAAVAPGAAPGVAAAPAVPGQPTPTPSVSVPPVVVGPVDAPPAHVPPVVAPPVKVPAPTTAAERYGWGTPLPASDEFNYTGGPDQSKWDTIDGCWAGHSGNGKRCGDRSTVDGSKLIQTGTENGDTGWLSSKLNQQYGRWEARVRSFNTGNSGNEYHPLLIVWPQSEAWPNDGEYDFLENQAPGEACANAFIHYPHPNMPVQQEFQEEKNCGAPLSEWHTIAFEWTPDHVRGYVDGKEWYTLKDGAGPGGRKNIQDMPSGHLTIQFDNFYGGGMRAASYEVDWVRIYSLNGGGQTASNANGSGSTGGTEGLPAARPVTEGGPSPRTAPASALRNCSSCAA